MIRLEEPKMSDLALLMSLRVWNSDDVLDAFRGKSDTVYVIDFDNYLELVRSISTLPTNKRFLSSRNDKLGELIQRYDSRKEDEAEAGLYTTFMFDTAIAVVKDLLAILRLGAGQDPTKILHRFKQREIPTDEIIMKEHAMVVQPRNESDLINKFYRFSEQAFDKARFGEDKSSGRQLSEQGSVINDLHRVFYKPTTLTSSRYALTCFAHAMSNTRWSIDK